MKIKDLLNFIDELNADYQEVKKMIDAKDITIGKADPIVSE